MLGFFSGSAGLPQNLKAVSREMEDREPKAKVFIVFTAKTSHD